MLFSLGAQTKLPAEGIEDLPLALVKPIFPCLVHLFILCSLIGRMGMDYLLL